MAIVIGPCWMNFCSQKLKRGILATFGFNRTALRATQPKLPSMFCALYLKIALPAAELMSFGHHGAAIWHLWTIYLCGAVKDKCYAGKFNCEILHLEVKMKFLKTTVRVMDNGRIILGFCDLINWVVFSLIASGIESVDFGKCLATRLKLSKALEY